MKSLVFLFCLVSNISLAQTANFLKIKETYFCAHSELSTITNGDFVWMKYQEADRKYEIKEYKQIKEKLNSKIVHSDALSNASCIYLATILKESDTIKAESYISIYQLSYRNEYQVEKLINVIKKKQCKNLRLDRCFFAS